EVNLFSFFHPMPYHTQYRLQAIRLFSLPRSEADVIRTRAAAADAHPLTTPNQTVIRRPIRHREVKARGGQHGRTPRECARVRKPTGKNLNNSFTNCQRRESSAIEENHIWSHCLIICGGMLAKKESQMSRNFRLRGIR